MTAAFSSVKSAILSIFLAGVFLSASLRGADEKKMTVVDYFLLPPKDTLEAPPRAWLDNHAQVVDKQNGYISITGDGAQPSFQVALFRYRDGRALLVLCSGELEGDDLVTLEFFELGTDGKMHKAPRKVFPIGDRWSSGEYDSKYEDLQFELPRRGRTILVRKQTGGKVLRKFTWNGEKFAEER